MKKTEKSTKKVVKKTSAETPIKRRQQTHCNKYSRRNYVPREKTNKLACHGIFVLASTNKPS